MSRSDSALKLQDRAKKNQNTTPAVDNIYKQVIKAYEQQVLNNFLACFMNNTVISDAARNFLRDNWIRSKHTLCSYSALVDSEVMQLLFDVAGEISFTTEPAITLLIPGLITESMLFSETLSDLSTIPLSEVFRTHILGCAGDYLIPVSQIIPLEQSRYEVDIYNQGLMNPYFDYEKHQSEQCWLSEEELYRLINHSSETEEPPHSTERFIHVEKNSRIY